jgi:hypothetical protein
MQCDVAVSLDPEGPAVTLQRQSFTLPALRWSASNVFSVGLGRTVAIRAEFTFDEISAVQCNLGPLSLLPTNGGTYSLAQGERVYPASLTYDMCGTCLLTGPSETKTERFSKRRVIYLGNRNPVWQIDARRYPLDVSLAGRLVLQWNSANDPPLVDTMIDGVRISVTSGGECWEFSETATLHLPQAHPPSKRDEGSGAVRRSQPRTLAPPNPNSTPAPQGGRGRLRNPKHVHGSAEGTSVEKTTSNPLVFVSYSHHDAKWLKGLMDMMSPVLRSKALDIWYDGKIKPSQRWRDEINRAMKSAKVGLLFVSKHFFASDFIASNELPYLLDAADKRGVKLLCVHVTPSMFKQTPLEGVQSVNAPERPWNALRGAARDKAMLQAAEAVTEAVKPLSEPAVSQPERERRAEGSGEKGETATTADSPIAGLPPTEREYLLAAAVAAGDGESFPRNPKLPAGITAAEADAAMLSLRDKGFFSSINGLGVLFSHEGLALARQCLKHRGSNFGRSVQVECRVMLGSPDAKKEWRRFVLIEAVNLGPRPTTIEKALLRTNVGRELIQFGSNEYQQWPLPKRLGDGEKVSILMVAEKVREGLAKLGGAAHVVGAAVYDAAGNEYSCPVDATFTEELDKR